MARLVLASASPARLRLLRAAGMDPEVVVSGVDEDAVSAPDVIALVAALARAKAEVVAESLGERDALVLGCDSLLDVDGEAHGKPSSAGVAETRWRMLRGRSALLRTGHHLIDTRTGLAASAVATTSVSFGQPTDDEIAAYVATGEPLGVAGGFTLDGRSAPWIDGVVGDPGNVIGVSLPVLAGLLDDLDVSVTDLWSPLDAP